MAECQGSQGEYAEAIDTLKSAELENPKNADLPARLGDFYLARGDWEAAGAAAARARSWTRIICSSAGFRRGCWSCGANSTKSVDRLEMVRRSL